MTRRLCLPAILVFGLVLAGCGSQSIELAGDGRQPTAADEAGAKIFNDKCAGCHTLAVTGAEGGSVSINNRERVDGPNFDQRKETRDQVLYALRNGGFSGAIMPENLVVGAEADSVAAFLEKYSGLDRPPPAGPNG